MSCKPSSSVAFSWLLGCIRCPYCGLLACALVNKPSTARRPAANRPKAVERGFTVRRTKDGDSRHNGASWRGTSWAWQCPLMCRGSRMTGLTQSDSLWLEPIAVTQGWFGVWSVVECMFSAVAVRVAARRSRRVTWHLGEQRQAVTCLSIYWELFKAPRARSVACRRGGLCGRLTAA